MSVQRQYGVYLVSGRRRYRGHEPGTTFEAMLDRPVEQRAIQRGDIRLLRRIVPSVQPGSYRFPAGWLPPGGRPSSTADQEPPRGGSLIRGGQ